MQTDAAINYGNSGGPLFSYNGEVVAMVTVFFSDEGHSTGLNFAIPSNILKKVINQLRDYGTIHRSWIGISVSPINKGVVHALGISKQQSGVVITKVEKDSPASVAGIQIGDILLSINDEKISDETNVEYILNNLTVGTVIPIQIMRHLVEMKLSVKVGSRNEDDFSFNSTAGKEAFKCVPREKINGIDVEVTDLTAELRKTLEVPDSINGVLVSNAQVSSDSDICNGNVIMMVNQKAVASVAQLKSELQKLSGNEEIRKRGKIALYIFDPLTKRYDYVAVDFCGDSSEKITNKQINEKTMYESFKDSLRLK
jgi:serine protease Do